MTTILIIGGSVLAAFIVLAIAGMLIGTGRERADIWAQPQPRPRHARGDWAGGHQPDAETAILIARAEDDAAPWPPEDDAPPGDPVAEFRAAAERDKGKPVTVLPEIPPQSAWRPGGPVRGCQAPGCNSMGHRTGDHARLATLAVLRLAVARPHAEPAPEPEPRVPADAWALPAEVREGLGAATVTGAMRAICAQAGVNADG